MVIYSNNWLINTIHFLQYFVCSAKERWASQKLETYYFPGRKFKTSISFYWKVSTTARRGEFMPTLTIYSILAEVTELPQVTNQQKGIVEIKTTKGPVRNEKWKQKKPGDHKLFEVRRKEERDMKFRVANSDKCLAQTVHLTRFIASKIRFKHIRLCMTFFSVNHVETVLFVNESVSFLLPVTRFIVLIYMFSWVPLIWDSGT